MAIAITVKPSAAVSKSAQAVELQKGFNKFRVSAGEQIQLVDTLSQQAPADTVMQRAGDTLLIDIPSQGIHAELEGFYATGVSGQGATLELPGLDQGAAGGAAFAPIDGGFGVQSLSMSPAEGASAGGASGGGSSAAGGTGISSTALIIGGVLVAGAAAAGASGGGGGATPVPVPTPVPTPAPAPAPLAVSGITTSAAAVNEGDSVVVTIATNQTSGSISYTLSGVSAADIEGGTLTGSATIGADGKATVQVKVAADKLTEGAETLSIVAGGVTKTVTINDTSTTVLNLTTGIDNLAGTAGNDLISDAAIGGAQGLTNLDIIDGGLGTNSIVLAQTAAFVDPVGAKIANIQNLTISAVGGIALDASSTSQSAWSGLANVTTTNSGSGNTNLTLASGASVKALNNAGGISVAGGNAVDAQTTTGNINVSKAAGAVVAQTTTGDIDVTGAVAAVTAKSTAGGTVTVAGGTSQNVSTDGGDVFLTGATAGVTATVSNNSDGYLWVDNGTSVNATATNVDGDFWVYVGTNDGAFDGKNLPTGAVNVNVTGSTKVALNGEIYVEGGSSVSITQTTTAFSGSNSNSYTEVGYNGDVTGAVTVNNTTTAAFNTLTNDSYLQSVYVGSGTVVSVNQVATNGGADNSKDGLTTSYNVYQGYVEVDGNASTTAVTVSQSAAVTAKNGTIASGTASTETASVVFLALAAGETQEVGGLTFRAGAAGTTVAETASAFASLASGVTKGTSALGTYTGSLSGFSSAAASGTNSDTVVFTSTKASSNVTNISETGTATATTTDGSAVTAAVAAVGGIATGQVYVYDANYTDGSKSGTIATANLTNFAYAQVHSSALSSLTLTGSKSGDVVINAVNTKQVTTLDLTLDTYSAGSTVTDLTNHYTTLNLHTKTGASKLTLVDSAATALSIDGTQTVTLTATGLSSLATVVLAGSAGLSTSTLASSVTDVNASKTSGNVSVNLGAGATYEGGSGADKVTISAAPNKLLDGGAGSGDVLVVASSSDVLAASISTIAPVGFENLGVTVANAGITASGFANVWNLGTGAVVFNKVAAGAQLYVTDSSLTTVNLADVSGKADSVTVHFAGSAALTDTVTLAGIESVTLDVGNVDSKGVAQSESLTLVAVNATSVNLSGASAVSLTVTGDTALTKIDGSALTGALTVTTAGTVGETVLGGSGADKLTAASGSVGDTLTGNGGNDTLTSNAGLTTLTGGAGNDVFVVGVVGADLSKYTTVTDFSVGDQLKLIDSSGTESFVSKAIAPVSSVFADFLDAATAANGNATGTIAWFNYGGNTFVVENIDGGASFTAGTDLVVKLSGTIDLSHSGYIVNSGAPVLQLG